jgi:hypothetical protein
MNIDHCYLNIPRSERKWPLYRIISLGRLYELFEKRVNTLVKPVAWDDPFENFVRGLKGRLPSGEVVEFAHVMISMASAGLALGLPMRCGGFIPAIKNRRVLKCARGLLSRDSLRRPLGSCSSVKSAISAQRAY